MLLFKGNSFLLKGNFCKRYLNYAKVNGCFCMYNHVLSFFSLLLQGRTHNFELLCYLVVILLHRNVEENTSENIHIQMSHFATDSSSTLAVIFVLYPPTVVRWPNTVFTCTLADVIQRTCVD